MEASMLRKTVTLRLLGVVTLSTPHTVRKGEGETIITIQKRKSLGGKRAEARERLNAGDFVPSRTEKGTAAEGEEKVRHVLEGF